MALEYQVRKVEPLDDYKLLLTFEDKSRKVFDCSFLLQYKLFEPLKNKGFFRLAHTDGCAVVWNDTLDLDPMMLYNQGVPYEE